MSTVAADWISPASAIAVAIIAGAFSFLGLVLSKEQKVSELRQAWIDGLREDLAAHISAVFAVKYLREVYEYERDEPSQVDIAKAISEPHTTAAATFHRILLRLNPDDKNIAQKELITELKKMRDCFIAANYDSACTFAPAIQEQGRLVLKAEWERVKRGELTFRFDFGAGSYCSDSTFCFPNAAHWPDASKRDSVTVQH